jgi:hypothetical protein
MAKSYVRNKLGDKRLSFYLPATASVARTFCDAVCDGETSIYSMGTSAGSDAVTTAEDVTVMIQNETTLVKGYLRFIIDSTKNESDVFTALIGKNINGIVVDKVVIISMRTVQY